jgi:hypothetical protein
MMSREELRNPSSLPDAMKVLRLVKPSLDGQSGLQVSAIQLEPAFELSSKDKQGTPPHLSVWVESLTSDQEAYMFLEEGSPRKLVLRLNVEQIRAIVAVADDNRYPKLLDVIFVPISEQLPGAIGHSGIVGLDEAAVKSNLVAVGVTDLTNKQIKLLRKDLRAQLADLASKDFWLLDTET